MLSRSDLRIRWTMAQRRDAAAATKLSRRFSPMVSYMVTAARLYSSRSSSGRCRASAAKIVR